MFMRNNNQYPAAPQSQGNLQDIIPAAMTSLGALGGMGGGNGFMQGFNSTYNPDANGISIAPIIGQSNFARLNTLGGLVSPISGGLY